MITFASASVAVVLPEVVAGLGVFTTTGVWAISVYMLVLAVSTGLYGRLSDLYGIRAPMVVGCLFLALGSVGAALAPTFAWLMVARVVQAVGAASLPALVMSFLERVHVGRAREIALARMAGVAIAVGSVGPLLGGAVAHVLGWRATLLLPVLCLVALVPVLGKLPREGSGARLDLVGALLVTAVSGGVVLLLQAPSVAWPAARTGLIVLLVAVPWTVVHVRRRPDGFVPRAVATDLGAMRLTLVASTVPSIWFALMLVLPATLALQGWSAWQVGLAMTPSAVSGLLSSRVTPGAVERWGPATLIRFGAAVSSLAALVCGLGVMLDHPVATPALLVLASFVSTAVAAACQSSLVSYVGNRFELSVRGAAMGTCTLLFLLGAAFGSAAQGGMEQALGPDLAVFCLALLPALGALVGAGASRPEDSGAPSR